MRRDVRVVEIDFYEHIVFRCQKDNTRRRNGNDIVHVNVYNGYKTIEEIRIKCSVFFSSVHFSVYRAREH